MRRGNDGIIDGADLRRSQRCRELTDIYRRLLRRTQRRGGLGAPRGRRCERRPRAFDDRGWYTSANGIGDGSLEGSKIDGRRVLGEA